MSRQKTKARVPAPADSQLGRINKVLAAAGLGSRRQVEELIVQGRVEVDGNVLTDLGTRVDPQTSKIKVDGVLLKRPKLVYYALNKPKGVLSTNHDPSGRPRVVDFVPDRHRVFSVGRLDLHSEGLVLLTNDGTLAQRLAHPRFRVQKTYFVVVAGLMNPEELNQLRKGVYLAEGVARIDGARIRKARKGCTELEIQLSEGKNREIRRLLARAGHKVVLLRRISIGPLRLGELPSGAARELTQQEVQSLYLCTSQQKKTKASIEKPQETRRGTSSINRDETPLDTEEAQQPRNKTMHAGSKTLPLAQPPSDDFGLGLDDDSFPDEQSIPLEFQFSQESLKAMENELDEPDEDDWDDDFATDFSALNSTGSVIGAEEESPQPKTGKGIKNRAAVRTVAASPRAGQPRGSGTPKSGSSRSRTGNQPAGSKRGASAPKAARRLTKKKAHSATTAAGRPSSASRPASSKSRSSSSRSSSVRGSSSQSSSSTASRPQAKASRFKGAGAKGPQSKRHSGKSLPKRTGGKKRSR